MFDDQARHIAYIIREAQKRQALTVEPSVEAQEAWVETVHSLAVNNRAFLEACTPGYYNNEGSERPGSLAAEVYAPGINAFNEVIAQWRAKGDLEGMILGQ
jgi:cyclohexanone monooxygenase